MITAKNLSFSYGYGPVFDAVNFSVVRGDKVGIVGSNGAGKSTLFKLLTRQEFVSDGVLKIDAEVAMVPQEVKQDPLLSAADSIYTYIDPSGMIPQAKIHEILNGLEFDWRITHTDLSALSGGQKTKLALARAFVASPEILLLDEPTNFLDVAGKKWVMHFLATYPHTLLIVSHDLELLDRQIKHVLFLNPHTHKIETYTGNYSACMQTKREQENLLRRKISNEKKHIKQMEAGLVNLRKKTSKKGVRQRVMQERKIERLKDKLPEAPAELKTFTAKFPTPISVGQVPLRARSISKSYGEQQILSDFSLDLIRGERLALIGPNGVGKTTLIKILTKSIAPDTGEVIHADSLSLGYYTQESASFDDTQTLLQAVEATHMIPSDKIYGFLRRFLFPIEHLKQAIGTLSGGEKTRLAIAILMLYPHNVLVLDEPTTYLDVMSQRIILEALKAYTGAMLLVSHTEEFVQELSPNRVLLLPEQQLKLWTPDLLDQVSVISA